MDILKKYGMMFVFIGVFAFLVIAWWVNGKDDTWLYIFCVWLVLYSAYEVYKKKPE